MAVFNDGLLTPNDAFCVRYHLSAHSTRIAPATFRLRVRGKVNPALERSLATLKRLAPPVELTAVNQCSSPPRMPRPPSAIGVGTGIEPAPPSEPDRRVSRIRLSSW